MMFCRAQPGRRGGSPAQLEDACQGSRAEVLGLLPSRGPPKPEPKPCSGAVLHQCHCQQGHGPPPVAQDCVPLV